MRGTGQKVMEAEGIQTSSPLLSHCSQINWQPIKAIKKLTHTRGTLCDRTGKNVFDVFDVFRI